MTPTDRRVITLPPANWWQVIRVQNISEINGEMLYVHANGRRYVLAPGEELIA